MINYIQHEQEFYGVIKLISGEEVLGPMLATEEEGQTVIYVSHPAKPHSTFVNKSETQHGIAIGFTKWMMFAEEDFYIVNESDVVCIAPMSDDAIQMYKMWLLREYGKDADDDYFHASINENMGLVGKVDELRKQLEKQWKNSNSVD